MGVHGLTTYLRENKRALSKTLELPLKSEDILTPIVVDGWSFIYALYQNSGLPWVYGGEYENFSRLVTGVIEAWIKVGFRIYFVFDGAYPQLKFSTLTYRLGQSHIQPSLLFFRTSPVSRGKQRFLHETRIIPPLLYTVCVQALETIRQTTDVLEIHFADEEGDPYAVELAGRIGGYVIGNDSDFVVLNSEGYLGYIPVDEMVWSTPVLEDEFASEDGEFQTVRNTKAKRKPLNISQGLIPPVATSTLTLTFTAYSPNTLASLLKIPPTLLPLLGALVGNDFTIQSESSRRNVQSLFFERQLTLTQRINRVSTTIQSILSPNSQKRREKHQVDGVMDLIDKTVNTLLTRSVATMGSGEVESIVEKIVEATLQYAIPRYEGDLRGEGGLWTTEVCALHEPEVCPFLPMVSRMVVAEGLELDGEESEEWLKRVELRGRYLDAYRKGTLCPKIMDILNTGSFWPRLFLENPDLETVCRSIGQPIRQWIYAILDDAFGLPDIEYNKDGAERTPQIDNSDDDDDDDDELIDVVESDEEGGQGGGDPLAPLKGALQRLHDSDDEVIEPPASVTSTSRASRPQVITEYIRRGTRVAEEAVTVVPLTELLQTVPSSNFNLKNTTLFLLGPQENRFKVLLQVLGSDIPSVRALPQQHLMTTLALRWVLRTMHLRAHETNSKEREKERWTRREARCFLASCYHTASEDTPNSRNIQELPSVIDRNAQLMAQVLMSLETIEYLSQVLLLTERVPSMVSSLSGRLFHAYLTGVAVLSDNSIPAIVQEASESGLDDTFADEKKKKAKKSEKSEEDLLPQKSLAKKNGTRRGLYELLADVEL